MDELQFTLGEGPAVDAAGGDRPVLAADLAEPQARRRWPAFAAGAVAREVRAVFAFPVGAGAARLGVLNVYRRAAGQLSPAELADVLAYADAVLVLALDQRSGLGFDAEKVTGRDLPERRAEVHQAAGMASVQLGIGVAEALSRLRAYAYLHDLRLADAAADLVARRFRFLPDVDTGMTTDGDGNKTMGTPPSRDDQETEGER
ncbi:GAF domain-containing protein [Jiangella muralis]|uniref:GAF domain-containing protein n=1 Tax=Jiangella muralis TaxID=702383 RepID=UPI0012F7BD5B|nr:GAF domain-containing protein [Jiangella muralis]